MNITDNIGDDAFTNGMAAKASDLGDKGTTQWDKTFLQELDGVALITGDSDNTVNQKLASVKQILSKSVKEVTTMTGDGKSTRYKVPA